jgi:3-oxoacyl-[acyl-carrier-protein] synthase-3
MNAYINAISYYLPNLKLTNEDLARKFPEWSADKISSKTGIYERRQANDDESSCDLAEKACEKLFLEHNIDRKSIDFILLCTQSPDYFLPTTACILQNRLSLSTSCGALDFNLGCSGYVYGLSLAKGLIKGGIANRILLVTSETYSKFINKLDKGNLSIFGDAAAATLISHEEGICEIDEFILGTDGSGADNLIVKNGGIKHRDFDGFDYYDESNNLKNDNFIFMNGAEIFNFTNKAVPKMVKELLDRKHLTIHDIDLFVFHQANEFMLNAIRKKMNIPLDKFFIYLKECGNTVSSTIPIALNEAIKSKAIKKNHKVITAGFGVGYSWGATLLKF